MKSVFHVKSLLTMFLLDIESSSPFDFMEATLAYSTIVPLVPLVMRGPIKS